MVSFQLKRNVQLLSKEEEETLVLLTRSSSLILVPFLIFSFNISLILSETANLMGATLQVWRRCGREKCWMGLQGRLSQFTSMPHTPPGVGEREPFMWDGARRRGSAGETRWTTHPSLDRCAGVLLAKASARG